LRPEHVRQALEKINYGTLQGADFIEGNMGCAQETLDMILKYLHREVIDPNYLEQWMASSKESKFQISNRLDDMGCTPKCAAHLAFGI
jgi:hypothetical protein